MTVSLAATGTASQLLTRLVERHHHPTVSHKSAHPFVGTHTLQSSHEDGLLRELESLGIHAD